MSKWSHQRKHKHTRTNACTPMTYGCSKHGTVLTTNATCYSKIQASYSDTYDNSLTFSTSNICAPKKGFLFGVEAREKVSTHVHSRTTFLNHWDDSSEDVHIVLGSPKIVCASAQSLSQAFLQPVDVEDHTC